MVSKPSFWMLLNVWTENNFYIRRRIVYSVKTIEPLNRITFCHIVILGQRAFQGVEDGPTTKDRQYTVLGALKGSRVRRTGSSDGAGWLRVSIKYHPDRKRGIAQHTRVVLSMHRNNPLDSIHLTSRHEMDFLRSYSVRIGCD